jgi:hypothetical protein
MCPRQVLDDCEAQTGAAEVARPCTIDTIETLE